MASGSNRTVPTNSRTGDGGGGGSSTRRRGIPNPRSEVVRLAEKREKLQQDLDQLEGQLANYEATYLKGSP